MATNEYEEQEQALKQESNDTTREVIGTWLDQSRLSTVEDVRPYAEELVDFLDAVLKPDPNAEQNRQRFANQTVAATAAIGMVTMGWAK